MYQVTFKSMTTVNLSKAMKQCWISKYSSVVNKWASWKLHYEQNWPLNNVSRPQYTWYPRIIICKITLICEIIICKVFWKPSCAVLIRMSSFPKHFLTTSPCGTVVSCLNAYKGYVFNFYDHTNSWIAEYNIDSHSVASSVQPIGWLLTKLQLVLAKRQSKIPLNHREQGGSNLLPQIHTSCSISLLSGPRTAVLWLTSVSRCLTINVKAFPLFSFN